MMMQIIDNVVQLIHSICSSKKNGTSIVMIRRMHLQVLSILLLILLILADVTCTTALNTAIIRSKPSSSSSTSRYKYNNYQSIQSSSLLLSSAFYSDYYSRQKQKQRRPYFTTSSRKGDGRSVVLTATSNNHNTYNNNNNNENHPTTNPRSLQQISATNTNTDLLVSSSSSRRGFVTNTIQRTFEIATFGLITSNSIPLFDTNNNNYIANAAVGTLPEYQTNNSVQQGITIRVADKSQLDSMILFLQDGFNCNILRRRIRGTVEDVWMGYGPEQLSIPSDFTPGISSLAQYGGHASIHIVYDSNEATPLYRTGSETLPGNNIAYIQMGVPGYRISQLVANGGVIIDAYGIVDVISPSGIPFRGIVGIAPDPIMFIAINCVDVTQSKFFYEQLGYKQQEYPYARPSKGTGQFEPPQPKNSVYMSLSTNCMGLLLLPTKGRNRKVITPNPAFKSLNIIYTPPNDSPNNNNNNNNNGDDDDATKATTTQILDPSGLVLGFQSVSDFELIEKLTR